MSIRTWQYHFPKKELKEIKSSQANSVDETALSIPEGVYTTIRTYEKKYVLHLKLHLNRLIEGFEFSKISFIYEINDLRGVINAILGDYCCDLRIRLHIPFSTPETCYIFVEELPQYAMELYKEGVKVKTNRLKRVNPKVKLTNFIKQSMAEKQLIKNSGIEESIMVDSNGFLLEGVSSNFFAIVENALYTAEENVLHGITRKILLEEAEKLNLRIHLQPINIKDLNLIDEAFITSTSRNVMPIQSIDKIMIGDGKPGTITNQLIMHFLKRIKSETETIII